MVALRCDWNVVKAYMIDLALHIGQPARDICIGWHDVPQPDDNLRAIDIL